MKDYTTGIMHDGAAILDDGKPLTPEQIAQRLNTYHRVLSMVTKELELRKETQEDNYTNLAIATANAVLNI